MKAEIPPYLPKDTQSTDALKVMDEYGSKVSIRNELLKSNPEYNCPEKYEELDAQINKKYQEEQSLLKENSEALQVLSSAKKPVQRLGQGVHNNTFYYGTSLNYSGIQISAIVTSERKVYLGYDKALFKCASCGNEASVIQRNPQNLIRPKKCSCGIKDTGWNLVCVENPIRDIFGLNYRTQFNDEALDYVWSSESITKFIKKNYEKKTLKELYDTILKLNEKYIDHYNVSDHKFIACWIIGTYCFSLFENFGRLYFRAERGSGKTKQTRVLKHLVFNPMWVTKGTPSSIFRDIEATCGTPLIDNMDKLHEELKREFEHQIETGWMYDATHRLTDKDSMRTQKFASYAPIALNNIYGLDENTIDKTFEIPMLKSINKEIKRLKVTPKSESWEEIRDNLRFWVLDNWELITKTYDETTADISGREYDVVEGVLCVAKLVDEKVYENILSLVKDRISENSDCDLENNKSYIVFTKVWETFQANPELQEGNIFLSDIGDSVFKKFNPDLETDSKEYANRKKGLSKLIAKIIKSVPMFRKGGLSGGKTYLTIKRQDLERYMELQHFFQNDDKHLQPSTSSTCSTSSTKSTVDVVDVVDVVEEKNRVDVKDLIRTDITIHKCQFKPNGKQCTSDQCEHEYKGQPICNQCTELLKGMLNWTQRADQ